MIQKFGKCEFNKFGPVVFVLPFDRGVMSPLGDIQDKNQRGIGCKITWGGAQTTGYNNQNMWL